MPSGVPRVLWVGLVLLGTNARAAGLFHRDTVETVYVTPTAAVVAPTSYSYVLPAAYSYVTPTVYTTGALLSPAYYLSSTAYVVPTTYTYRAARYRPTRYVYDLTPTTYYYPTTLDVPLVTTSSTLATDCVETVLPPSFPAAPSARGTRSASPSGSGSMLQSTPNGDGEAGLNPNAVKGPQGQQQQQQQQQQPPGAGATETTPPTNPAPEPGDGGIVNPPGNPGGGMAANPQAAQKRVAARPAFRDLSLLPLHQAPALLQGRVVSGTTGDPVAGVKVIFSNPRFDSRSFTSDERGRFDVKSLPEGDWKVEIEEAAGNKTYSSLTVSGGHVTDRDGHELTGLTLNR
jgi:hypothetical protein